MFKNSHVAAMKLPSVPLSGGMTHYLREVWKFPLLEPQEEYKLAVRWRDHGDVKAAHKLVTSHLRLVARIAMGYRGYGLPVCDLMSEGSIGLMKAVKKFDPEMGFRLSTYAMWWIKASITEYVLRSWSMVKLGTMAAQKKLFFSLRKIKSRLNLLEGEELTGAQTAKLSKAMNIKESEIIDMNRRLTMRDLSLNAPLTAKDALEFQDTLIDDKPSPEAQFQIKQEASISNNFLRQAIAALPDRERRIFVERRLTETPPTLDDLGKRFGVSRERVRQLEVRAYNKVKEAVAKAAAS